jgi:type I restriction enzyme S subunit
VSAEDVKRVEIPIFSIEEQRKVVSTLKCAQDLLKKREYANHLANKLIQAVFLKMFDDPLTNPRGWKLLTLKQTVTDIRPGFAYGKYSAEEGIPHLRPFNISKSGELYLGTMKFVPKEKASEEYKLQLGDVIFNNTNSRELVGKTALINKNFEATFSNHITRLRFDKEIVLPEYAGFLLNYFYHLGLFASMCKKWVNQAAVDTKQIQIIKLPVPPIELQNKFATIVDRLEELKEKQSILTQQIDGLFNSLMSEAYKGELV